MEPRWTLDDILDRNAIRPVYQPIVRLETGHVVGFEALARGPEGSDLEAPHQLFAAARAAGRLEALDWACKTAAIQGALDAKLRPLVALFVNSEPEVGSYLPPALAHSWALAKKSFLRVFFEITERAVMEHPSELLRGVRDYRLLGWGVAVDDVGADRASIALLPFVEPDVIKLDMSLIHSIGWATGETVLAVNAEAERSGALILAEGIETREHLELAKAFGAELGQGWYFGRPGPIDAAVTAGVPLTVRPHDDVEESGATPFDFLSGRIKTREVPVAYLRGASRLLEQRAAALPHPPLVIAAFQDAARFESAKDVYEDLARRLPFVAVIGRGMAPEPAKGVRGVAIPEDDPLCIEWAVASISPYSGMLLTAREVQDDSTGRLFEAGVTFDRDLTIQAASYLIKRIARGGPDEATGSAVVDFAIAVADALAQSESLDELARPILAAMAKLTGLHSTFLSRIHDDVYDIVVSYNDGPLEVHEGTRLPWTDALCRHALEEDRQTYADVQRELPQATMATVFGFRGFVTCPVVVEEGHVIGTLCGATTEPGQLSPRQLEMVRSFARLIARQLAPHA